MTQVKPWPEAVLSEKLRDALQGRSIRSAVFTTYTFDPGFFELHVLPTLFSQSFSQSDKVRLLQLEDALREVDHLAVYYDRGALSQEAEPARLDYRRIDVCRKNGVFHPKLVLLLVEDPRKSHDSDRVREALVVACLSANLSRAGWWESIECAHIEEICEQDREPKRIPFRSDLLAILMRIRRCAIAGEDHSAIDAVRGFLLDRVNREMFSRVMRKERWYTRMFPGRGKLNLANWLKTLRFEGRDWNLEVISPFYDARGAAPIAQLVNAIKPLETRVFVPRNVDGSLQVTAEAYEAIAAIEGVRVAELPDEFTLRSKRASREKLLPRRVHAKVYRLWHEDGRDVAIFGSVNCTSAATSHGSAGNIEASFLVDISDLQLPRSWWLNPLEKAEDHQFVDTAPDEGDGLDQQTLGLSIRYDWGENTLEVRSEQEVESPIQVTDISNVHLFKIDSLAAEAWRRCDESAASALRKVLRSSSFVVLHYDNTRWRVLVREEGMAHRPSVLSDLSAEEILEYWSLLSADERAAFLERQTHTNSNYNSDNPNDSQPTDSPDQSTPQDPSERTDTLFDRFAGIFHAFGCLSRNMKKALDDNRYADAEMRLLGAKYDSLPVLLSLLLEQENGDPILTYVMFLTAKQVRDSLKKRYSQFFCDRSSKLRKLDQLIEDGLKRRDRIFSRNDHQEVKFLEWFEPLFLKDLSHL